VRWFGHLKISQKLGLGFGAVLFLMLAMAALSVRQLAAVNHDTEDLATNWMPSIKALAAMRFHTLTVRRRELSLLLADEKEIDTWKAQINEANRQLSEDFKIYEPLISSPEENQIYRDYRNHHREYLDIQDKVVKLATENRRREASRLAQREGRVALDAALEKVSEDIQLNVKGGIDSAAHAKIVYARARIWVISMVAGAFLLTVLFTLAITRSIAVPVHETMTVLKGLADRDLTRTVHRDSNDEIGTMAKALNLTIEALRDTMATISQSAEHLASASEEISAGAGQTSQSAKTQSDQSLQVATAMQEMAATVLEISQNSHRASTASRGAAEAARNGGKVVEETLSTMRGIADSTAKAASTMSELGKSSEQIGKIISVIDDIADQTNLLALNAAIEAARAGEQGRGFAVVADEVRKLAERTTNATKEITVMIQSIQSETRKAVSAMQQGTADVQVGLEKTSASGAALRQIILMAEEVGDMISTIATAATEQSAATEEINSGVSHISSSTQSASSASEETAKACSNLSTLASDLQKLVSQFKLNSASPKVRSAQRTLASRDEPPGGQSRSALAGM
jgi:methyl-accepting chemotaxis protein